MKPQPELFDGAEVRFWDIDPHAYQTERDHVRRSHLELLRESAKLYEHHVVLGNPRPDKKSFRVGRALHVEVLQPELAEQLLVVPPTFNKRTNAGKEQLRRWQEALPPGAIVLTRDERQTVECMARSLRSDPRSAALLERDGATELPLEWEDPITGLPCKAMLDKYFETRDGSAVRVLDLKSTNDPSEDAFAKTVASFGYHRQDAMYRDAARRYAGGRPLSFAFLVVRNVAPFEVAIYDLSDVTVDAGRRQIRKALNRLAAHLASGDWRAPWQGALDDFRPTTISIPNYALKEAA